MAGSFEEYQKGKWSVQFYYTDATGKKKRKHKLGFKTKREAKQWMDGFITSQQMDAEATGVNMLFPQFVDDYFNKIGGDLRGSTISTKRNIIDVHITPYFKDKKVIELSALDIVEWQNDIKKKGFSDTYLKTIQAQFSAIMNYAVKVYNLQYNPCRAVKGMGKNVSGSKGVWTQEDMESFLDAVKDKPEIYYAFMLIYWTGLRVGELLALNIEDIDFEKKTLKVSKSLNRVGSEDIITDPKTEKSKRTIYLPDFVVDAMKEYVNLLYGRTEKDRLFVVTKSHLEKEIKRGAELAGLKPIRIHDLRHSHASLLIEQGVDIATISNRLGHEKVSTTLDIYGHMFDSKAKGVADTLDKLYGTEEG